MAVTTCNSALALKTLDFELGILTTNRYNLPKSHYTTDLYNEDAVSFLVGRD
jgi:hypothetical protein